MRTMVTTNFGPVAEMLPFLRMHIEKCPKTWQVTAIDEISLSYRKSRSLNSTAAMLSQLQCCFRPSNDQSVYILLWTAVKNEKLKKLRYIKLSQSKLHSVQRPSE